MANTVEDIQKLYIAYFNRPADPDGLAYWAAQQRPLASIATDFAAQPEYAADYDGVALSQVIDHIYLNLFGRSADLTGLEYWSSQVKNGNLTLGTAAVSILLGALGTDAATIQNKATAAQSFTTALNTPAEISAYSSASANTTAKAWLTQVTDEASLSQALSSKDATIASLSDAAFSVTTTAGSANITVTNTSASSIKAIFTADFTGPDIASSNISLISKAAIALSVVSEGTNATNTLSVLDDASEGGKLTSVTVSGSKALNLTLAGTNSFAVNFVDASSHDGGLTFSLFSLADNGTVKLGPGTDVISVATTSQASNGINGFEAISGIEKTAAVSLSVLPGDSIAKAAAIASADVIKIDSKAAVADADYNGTELGDGFLNGGMVNNGVLTFTGSMPATLDGAFSIANLAAETPGESVAFEYHGHSFVFFQGDGANTLFWGDNDIVAQLTGTTGITHWVEVGDTNTFYIV